MRVDHDRRIGADAEEHGVADRDLAGIAADDVPGRGADRRQQNQRAQPLPDRRARDQQRVGQHQHDQHDPEQEIALHVLPIRPCGRNHSTSTNRM